MGWQEERERLLADTIVFVQQTIGDNLIFAVKAKIPLTPEIEAAARHLRRYHTGPRPTKLADLRRELQALSEVFNNMQRSLCIKRERNDRMTTDRGGRTGVSMAATAA